MANIIPGSYATLSGDILVQADVALTIPTIQNFDLLRYVLPQESTLATSVRMVNFPGPGDSFEVNRIAGPATVRRKLPATPVEFEAWTTGKMTVRVDQYPYSAYLVESIAEMQNAFPISPELTANIGTAIRREFDWYIQGLRAMVNLPARNRRVFYTEDLTATGSPSLPLQEAAIIFARQILEQGIGITFDQYPLELYVTGEQYDALYLDPRYASIDVNEVKPMLTKNRPDFTRYGVTIKHDPLMVANSATGITNGETGTPEHTPGASDTSLWYPTQDPQGLSPFAEELPLTIGSDAAPCHTAILCIPNEWAVAVRQATPTMETARLPTYLADAMIGWALYGATLWRPECYAVVIHTRA